MTGSREKLRALVLTVLMVFSVFGGAVTLGAGVAAAANVPTAGNDNTATFQTVPGATTEVADVSYGTPGEVDNVSVDLSAGNNASSVSTSDVDQVTVRLYDAGSKVSELSTPYDDLNETVNFNGTYDGNVSRVVVDADVSSAAGDGTTFDAVLTLQVNPSSTLDTQGFQTVDTSNTGFISGRVSDQNNNDIQNANLTFRNTNRTLVKNTTTNSNGEYTIELPPGTYNATVRKPGFSTAEAKDLTVESNKTTAANFVIRRLLVPADIQVTPTSDSAFVGENNSFTVTVFDQNGDRLSGANVEASFDDSNIVFTSSGTTNASNTTNTQGQATFTVTSDSVANAELTFTAINNSGTNPTTTASKSFILNGEGSIQGQVVNDATTDGVEDASVWAVLDDTYGQNQFTTTINLTGLDDDDTVFVRLVDNETGEILDPDDYDFRQDGGEAFGTHVRKVNALNTSNSSIGGGYAVIDDDGDGSVTFTHVRIEDRDYYPEVSLDANNTDEPVVNDNSAEAFTGNLTYNGSALEGRVTSSPPVGAGTFAANTTGEGRVFFQPAASLTLASTIDRAQASGANLVDSPGFVNSFGEDTAGTNGDGDYKLNKLYTDFQSGRAYVAITTKPGFSTDFADVFVEEDGQFVGSEGQSEVSFNLEPEEIEPAQVNITQIGVHPPLSQTGGAPNTSLIEPFDNQTDDFVQQVPRDESVDVIEVETLDEAGNPINGTAIVEIEDNDSAAAADRLDFEGDFVGVLGGTEVANGTDTITVNTGGDGVATLLLETDRKTESLTTNKTAVLTNDRSATDNSTVEFVGVISFESASISGQVTDTDDTPLPDTVVWATEFEFASNTNTPPPQTRFEINPVGPNGNELTSQSEISADEVDEDSDLFRVTRLEYNATAGAYEETASANVTAGALEDYRFEDFPGVSVSIPPNARAFKLYTQTLDEVDASYTLDPVPAVNATVGGQDAETSYQVKGVKLSGAEADTVGNAQVAQDLTPGFTGTANVVIPIEVSATVGMVDGTLSAPSSATAGETITVSADVENTGGAQGTETIDFRVDMNGDGQLGTDETLASQEITLAAGASDTVSFDVDTSGLAADTYTHGVGVRGSADFLTAQLTIENGSNGSAPEIVPGSPAMDPDGDGVYEDVNGDGSVTPGDATVLFNAVFDGTIAPDDTRFDMNGDGSVTAGDATVLFNAAFEGQVP